MNVNHFPFLFFFKQVFRFVADTIHYYNKPDDSSLFLQGFCSDLSRTYMACVSGEFCQAQHLTSAEK